MRYIYCLKDPFTFEIKYVGQTNNLDRRFRTHLSKSVYKKSSEYYTKKSMWIRSVLEKNTIPIIDILDVCCNLEDSNKLEKLYIEKLSLEGKLLTNSYITDVTEFSQDTRNKMSLAKKGKKLEEIVGDEKAKELKVYYSERTRINNPNKSSNEEVKIKISETLKKFFENKENHWAYGKKMSDDHNDKLRNSKINNPKNVGNRKPKTDEQKQKLRDAIKGTKVVKYKILQYDLQENFIKEWNSLRDIEKFYITIRRNQISKCCKGIKSYYAGYIWRYGDIITKAKKD
jgi:hypothetical protein